MDHKNKSKEKLAKELNELHQVFRNMEREHHELEMTLSESIARYRAIVDDQTELICRFDPHGTLTFVNEAYCRFFSKNREGLLGSSFMPLIPASDRKKVKAHFDSLGLKNPVGIQEHRVIGQNEEIRWQQWTNRAIFDKQGSIKEFQAVGRDITDRKLTEEALSKAHDDMEQKVKERTNELLETNEQLRREIENRKGVEERLRESEVHIKGILNAAPAGIGLVRKRELAWVSERMCEMIGYSADELVGQSARVAYESDKEFERVGKVKYSEIQERGVGSVETRFKRKDGSVLDVFLSSSAVNPGDLSKGAIFTVLDITERKKVEVALRESEEKYRILVESSIDGIAIVQGTEMKFVNKALLDMYGATGAEEIIGHNFTKFVAHEHRDLLMQRGLERERGEEVPNRYEFKALKLDESKFDVEISVNPIFYQGKPARQAFLRDVSERKLAEDALRESEKKYRLLVDNLPSIVFKGYKDWSVEFFDEKIEVLTGHSMKEFNSGRMKWSDLVVEEDIAGARETFIRALKTDKSYVREYKIKAKSEDILWIQERANIVCDDKGEIDYVSGVFFDITKRKIAEETLRANEERLRRLLEASPDPIVVYDMEGKATYVNPAFVEIFGWSSQELLGKNIEFVPEENWPETKGAIARMLRGEKIQSFETRRLTKDGRILDIQLSSSVFHDRDDNTAGNIVILRDVTKRKKAEDAVRKSEAELAAQSRHLEEVNAALRVLLKQRENDKADLEERLLANVKELVLPYVEKLKNSRLHSDQMTLVGILESNMKEIVSPFVTRLSSRFLSLTPTEIQVASLIKDGKTSKEIAALLNASENTVRTHRFHIRSKLGIKNKKVNFRSYLQSLQE
jgi:PAS domain S-box-containing protein